MAFVKFIGKKVGNLSDMQISNLRRISLHRLVERFPDYYEEFQERVDEASKALLSQFSDPSRLEATALASGAAASGLGNGEISSLIESHPETFEMFESYAASEIEELSTLTRPEIFQAFEEAAQVSGDVAEDLGNTVADFISDVAEPVADLGGDVIEAVADFFAELF